MLKKMSRGWNCFASPDFTVQFQSYRESSMAPSTPRCASTTMPVGPASVSSNPARAWGCVVSLGRMLVTRTRCCPWSRRRPPTMRAREFTLDITTLGFCVTTSTARTGCTVRRLGTVGVISLERPWYAGYTKHPFRGGRAQKAPERTVGVARCEITGRWAIHAHGKKIKRREVGRLSCKQVGVFMSKTRAPRKV